MYLFDTDILSNLLKKFPSPHLIRKLAETPIEHQFTSSITLGELSYGANRRVDTPLFLEKILKNIDPSQVLSFDYDSALVYGKLRARLEKQGIVVPEADLRIGSIAVLRKMTMITGNTRHFSLIPELRVENWL